MRILPCLSMLMLCSCGWVSPAPQSSLPFGYFDSYEARWPYKALRVCWETDSRSFVDLSNYQAMVREVVTTQYERVGFAFMGWGPCRTRDDANIRVWVDPYTWPRVKAFGQSINRIERGLELTFDFLAAGNGWGAQCQSPEKLANCVRNYALHEFGHVLGLKHEADRDDAICAQSTFSPGMNIGPYDSFSIMNYCYNEAEIRANHVPVLSYNDVATLLEIYHEGTSASTFTAIAWSSGTGTLGSSWRWRNQAAADNTALGLCEQAGQQPGDCRVVAWAQDACAAFAVGQNQGSGWAWNIDRALAGAAAVSSCQEKDNGCQVLAAVCSTDGPAASAFSSPP